MPKLPVGLKESITGVPDKVKMPILCWIMPLAMAYATDVRVKYCDGKEQRLNLMSIIWGRQASGKSSVKDVIDIWKRPMKEADAANRQAEDEFKKLRKRAAVIGFRCAVVFQLLENGIGNPQCALGHGLHRESKNSLDFALLMADYALKYQTELFGRQLLEVAADLAETATRRTKNRALYDQLPDSFTFQMLQQAKPEAKYAALRMMCTLWKRGGLIRAVDVNQWQKC